MKNTNVTDDQTGMLYDQIADTDHAAQRVACCLSCEGRPYFGGEITATYTLTITAPTHTSVDYHPATCLAAELRELADALDETFSSPRRLYRRRQFNLRNGVQTSDGDFA